jgi:hypothetical protein
MFPARGRFAAGNDREDTQPATNFTSPRVTVLGSAWYHDEAVREEDPRRKN